VDKPDYRPRP
nr:Chain 1y, Metalnikowin I [Palomena prasina]5FDU_2y Chain 2y, Metalnikowin I [Palomena prasina]